MSSSNEPLSRAQLVIEGDCEGRPIELRGEVHFGNTGKGNCKGDFLLSPAIILKRDPKRATTSIKDSHNDERSNGSSISKA
ncbi:hypothetical protein F1C10_14330 [Sphingomonas sp. NBWT7]|uniref:hypothetical protein n=1 Tax=Sphingomonas sp. NBWT7 TaxID=2596913 RepID=UPI001627E58C|nr:hypothetical protein [Sphingomonas sp. NBWT7]QNE32980.1 hypothetical protein F1C10_14330 [Sphingomonas sp. NBWT7]